MTINSVPSSISVFDLFKIGMDPSSSHTMGPMRAARLFAEYLATEGILSHTSRIRWDLFGSLGATGVGHGRGPALVLGLEGEQPEQIDPSSIPERLQQIGDSSLLKLLCALH